MDGIVRRYYNQYPNELKNFFNQVQGWANNYCAQITGITDLVLGNWWVNINPKYTYNRRHDHQKSILSGVYYVDCEGENIGNLWWREMITWSFLLVGIKTLHRSV